MTDHDPTIDPRLAEALQRPAEVPLGLTARLEAGVTRRAREEIHFSSEEKLCIVALALGASVPVAGGLGVLALLVSFGVALGYVQWTILLDEEG